MDKEIDKLNSKITLLKSLTAEGVGVVDNEATHFFRNISVNNPTKPEAKPIYLLDENETAIRVDGQIQYVRFLVAVSRYRAANVDVEMMVGRDNFSVGLDVVVGDVADSNNIYRRELVSVETEGQTVILRVKPNYENVWTTEETQRKVGYNVERLNVAKELTVESDTPIWLVVPADQAGNFPTEETDDHIDYEDGEKGIIGDQPLLLLDRVRLALKLPIKGETTRNLESLTNAIAAEMARRYLKQGVVDRDG